MKLKEKIDQLEFSQSKHSREDLGFLTNTKTKPFLSNWNDYKVKTDQLHDLKNLFIYLNSFWLNKAQFKANIPFHYEISKEQATEIIDLVQYFSKKFFKVKELQFQVRKSSQAYFFSISFNSENITLSDTDKFDHLSIVLRNNKIIVKKKLTNNIQVSTKHNRELYA